jgi:hypothetical protein
MSSRGEDARFFSDTLDISGGNVGRFLSDTLD